MIKFYSFFIAVVLFVSCKDKNNLVEVALPEPEETVSVSFGNPADVKATGVFQLIPLDFSYEALKTVIDGKTMELHYGKHYLGYTNALNKEVAIRKELEKKTIEEILSKVSDKELQLKNNAGGFYNHSLFFEIIKPKGAKKPTDELLDAINTHFVSFSIFKNKFITEGNQYFGSGWVWLIVTKNQELKVVTTSNQENPLMLDAKDKGLPILGIDLWEHAYYLNYQNNKKKYLENIFDCINWTVVMSKYKKALENIKTIPSQNGVVKKEINNTSISPVEVKPQEISKSQSE
ncbi:Superoxide dismutase [Flavobacterium sp. 9AF]|uniref:superoxide dismutase n=1 Tax=Flavobacterium sp. 9AF TaxID=2653142 RepID=UPI0012F1D7ED|nr:superoxide dismutase [Flavobacterium sp. 9AF]VXB02298.1 Superoxide dismutase [Flavobacterium sp. 9AF]